MTGDFFTFDNGRDKRRVDYDQFLAGLDQLGDLSENAELQKIFSVFDERGNGNGKIDTESEALELFGFIKQMSGPDEILQQEEISNWLQSKEDLNDDEKANIFAAVNSFMNELPDDAEISYTDGRITRRVKNGVVKEYIYHEAENGKDAYVEIIGGENRFFVSEINEDGTLNNNSKILHSEINGVVKDYVYHEAQDGEPACVEIILDGQNRYYYDTVDSYGNPADGCKLLKKEERGLITEYVYHDAIGNEPAYVEVKTANNGTFKVLNVGLKGEFSYSDFISHEYINDENQKVTECYLQVDDMNLISERVELANNKVLTKVYGTSSYFDYYYHVKLMNDRECMQFYEEGNDEYCVYYDKNNNTITHAAYGDTVDSLIEKFGFESPEQFYELNPKLKDKEIKAADYIIVPGYYTANSPEILRQGTMQGEWDKFYKANLQSIRDEYFPNIEDELMYAMQDVEGFKVSQQTAQMYTKVNALDTDKRNIVLECIQNRARTDGAEEIKSKLYREYGINLYDDVSFNIPASSPQYTPDVLKYLTAKTFANNVEAASILFVNNTQRAGLVTDFVIDVNERFFDDDSRTQISRMLRCDRTSAILLEQASLGRLTKKDYYDIKMDLALSLLPRDASEADRNREYWRQDDNLKRALGDLTPEQLDAYIYSLAEMSDEEYEEMAPQMYEHLCEYAKNIVLREETQIPDFPQFSRLNPLGNGDLSISGRLGNTLVWPQMTFEEVFQLEMRVAYSAENMQDYFTKQDKFTLVARLYHEKEYIGGILRDAGSLATYPYGSEQNLGSAESQLLYALKELCGDDTEKINQLLASLGFSNIRLSESAFQSPVEMSEDGSISLALYNQRGLFSYYSEQEPLDIEELAEELHKPSNLYPMFGDGSGNLSGETIGAICQALISRLNSNYAIATEGKSLDYYKTQMDAAYREAFGYNNTERTVENYVKDLRSDVSTLEDIVTYAGAVILIGEQIIPVAGQYAAALEIAGYTLLFGNVALKTLDATTKEGGMTEEDRQEIAMALLGDLETVVMMGLTPLISKGFTKLGDVILTKTCPNLALKAALSKTIEGTTSWSLRTLNATRMVANSALTFGTWEALSGAGHYMIGMSNEESLGDAVVHGFGHGALFGTYMGLTGMGIRYLTGNMTKGIFKNKLPQVEEASEAALRQAESAFSEAQNFSGSQILNTYNSAFTNAMTHEGARVFSEATNFIMEVGAFTAYDVVGSLITNSKPEDLSWGEYIWETTKGQATNLLKLKALGYVMASHRLNSRASELFPNELKSEQDLYIEKVIRGGETKYEVRYPDGHRVTASNVSEVLNLANMHQQQVFLYDPLDKLLDEEGGTLDIGDGMRLVKDENGYGVEFSDHRRVNGTDLRSTIATANKIYTFEVNEQILKRDGQLTLYGQDYFYDKNTKQYRTQVDDNTLLVSESFMDVFNESISFRMSKFVEDSFASGKNAIMVDHNVFITKEGDEYRVVYLTENGEPFSPIGGNTVKEVIDQLFNETANPYTIYDKAHSEGVSYVEYTNPTENTNPLTNETGLTIYGDRTTGVNPNQTLTLPEGNEQLPPGYSIERAETGGKSEQHTSVDKVMQEGLSNDHNALFYNARKENPVWGSDIVESFGNPSMVAETPEQLYARAVERLKENTSLSEREIKDLAYYGINIREEEIQNLIIQCAQNGVDYSAYARFCSENIDGVRLQSAEVKERADFIRRAMENGLNSDDIGDLLSQYENVSKGELDGLLTEYTQRAEVTRATQEQFEAKRNGVIQRTNDAQTQRVIQEIIESSVCTEDNFDKIADLIGDNPNLARVNIIKQFIEGLPEVNSRYNRQFTLDDLETFFDNVLDPEILSDFERLGNGAVLRDVMLIESGQQGQRSTFGNVRAELKLILNRSVDDVQSISSLPENEQTIVIEHAKETLRGQDDWLRLCTNNSGDFVAQDCFIAEYLYNLGIPAYEARYYMGNMERGPKMFEQLQAVRDFGRSRLNSVPDEIFDRNKMTDVLQQFGYMPDGNGNYVVNYDLGQRVNNQGETRIYNLSANDVEIMNRMINIGDHKDFWKDMSPEKFIQTFVQFKNLFEIDMVSGKSIIGEYGEEFFNGIIKELKDSDITPAEKRAIDNFVADNYQQINRANEAMRTNRPLQTAEAMFAEDAQNLYNLIQRHTVSTDIELNRTERDPNRFDEVKLSDGTTLTQILNNFELYADRIDEINEELSNNPLHNDRFMSTALGSEQVMSGGLNWKVHLEEGSNAMFRNVYSETSQGEFEYIIQAGSDTTFRIEVITANDGRKYPQLVGYVTTPRDGAIGTGTEGTTEIFGTTGATDVNRSIASGENVADAPIRLTENVPVTPDEAKRMLIEAGFPESELEDIDFNNPAVLINTPAVLCAMRLKAFEFFENFDVNDNSEPGLERRREFYEQLSEISDDNTGFVRYLNDENVNTIRKYFEFGNEEDLDNIIGFFALGDRPHISEKIMQILPEMTRNGQRKLTVDEVKNLRYIQDELVPYLTPERARFAEMINSQIDNAQFKIKIFEFDRLGPDENLTEDFANRYVSAVRRLEELHIDTTDKFSETIQQDLARMEAIVAFMDRYNFDLNGTEDNWIFSSNVENLMARNDIAELQEYFNALVPEARHFGLRRLPKEGLSFQDYADLCNYLVTEPDLFEGINPYLNTACIMRFITDNNVTDIKGFTELIKSLKGTEMLKGYEYKFRDRVKNVPNQEYEAASRVINELKLIYEKPEDAEELDRTLTFVFDKFRTHNMDDMTSKLQYLREHELAEGAKEYMFSILDAEAPDVVEKYELLLNRGIQITSHLTFKNLVCNGDLSLSQLSAEIDNGIAEINEVVFQKCGSKVVERLSRQRYDEIVQEVLISQYIATCIEIKVKNYPDKTLIRKVEQMAGAIFNPSAVDVFDKYWGNPECKVSHNYIRKMAEYAKDLPESTIDTMYKVLVDAKMKKNQIKTFDEDLTDEVLEHFFIVNFENIGKTIALIGVPAFEYSYTSKIAGMKQLVDCVETLDNRYFHSPQTLENLAERLSDKTIEPQDRISKIKILAGLTNCSKNEEMNKFIELIKPSTPEESDVAFAKELWNNTKFWSSASGTFEEKFEQTFEKFCEHFGVDKNDHKIREFFEKRITTDSKGNTTHKGVKDSEIRSFLEKNIIRKRNQQEWNSAIYRKIFDIAEVEYSPELAKKLDIIDSPHLGSIFQGSNDFQSYFKVMLERLNEHPELSVTETFDLLPQNIETRRQFEEQNIPYDRYVNVDKNSYKTVQVVFSAEKAKNDAVQNIINEFNDVAFKSLPKEETDKILKALEEIGIKTISINVPEYDGDGYLVAQKEVLSFVDANEQSITFDNLRRMISVINRVMNENEFWTTKSSDVTLQANKDTFYSHITKDRSQEIDNALTIKGERTVELDIHQTDMNNLKMALFLGNGLCCTGVGSGCNQFSAPTYCMNKLISAIEITDGKNVVGNTMCYFGEVDGQLAFVLDNIEVLPGYQSDAVRDAFMDYAKQLCAEMGLPNIPIYAGPNRHKFHMSGVYDCQTHSLKIIGSTGEDEIYHDYKGTITVDGNKVIENIPMFLIYDGKGTTLPPNNGRENTIDLTNQENNPDVTRAVDNIIVAEPGSGEVPGVENSAVRNISEEVLMDRIRNATRREDFTEIRDQIADMPTDTPEQLEAKQRLQLVYQQQYNQYVRGIREDVSSVDGTELVDVYNPENERHGIGAIIRENVNMLKYRGTKKDILKYKSFSTLKNKEDLEALEGMLDNLIKSGFDISLIDHEYQYHNIITVAKTSQNPEEFINAITNTLIKNQDNVYVIKTLSRLIENASYTIGQTESKQIIPEDIINFVNAVNNSDITSEHLFSILNGRNDSPGALSLGDPKYLQHQWNFNSQNWASLSKILPILAKLDPKSKACIDAIELVRCADDIMRVHKVKPRDKVSLLQSIEDIPEEILSEMQDAGVNIIGLRDYLRFYLAEQNIDVESSTLMSGLGIVFDKNTETLLNSRQTEDFISEHQNTGIPVEYSRAQFARELISDIERLGRTDRDILLKQMGISVGTNDFNGIINPDRINVDEFSPEVRPIIEEVKSKTENFVRNNSVSLDNPELASFINGLIEFCPEFVSMIGKPMVGSDKTLDMYVLEVLNNVISDPAYQGLQDVDKYILKWSVLMHAIGQTTGITDIDLQYKMSARMANDLTKKYNLSQEVRDRMLNLVSNGYIWSTDEIKIDKYFRTADDFAMAKIFYKGVAEAMGIEDFNVYRYSGYRFTSQMNYAVKNTQAKEKYPKYTYVVDGVSYEIPVLDVRNMDPETDMTQYGYVGLKLKDITIQVHHTGVWGLQEIPEFYDDPNFYAAYSTSIRNIQHTGNGYGGIGYVFSTARINKGGGNLTWKEVGVGDLDDFSRQIYLSGLEESSTGHGGVLYPLQIADPNIREAWFNNAQAASGPQVNEVFALHSMPEQIELSGYEFPANEIPIEYIRVSIANGCMPILLTNQ